MEEIKSNKGLIIIICILSVLVLALGGYIVYDKYLSSNKNNDNNTVKNENSNNNIVKQDSNENNTVNTSETTINKKLVNNLSCKNSNTTFNNVSIELEQKEDDGVCKVQKFTINGKDIKEDISSWVDSYEIFDKSVIIMSGDTSGNGLYIYNTINSIMKKISTDELKGYWPKSYTTTDNKIIIDGVGCGAQCGYSESDYNKTATFEIIYLNGSFSLPMLVDSENN